MKLPEINYEDYPDEIKNAIDEGAEFVSLIDKDYALDFSITPEQYVDMKVSSAKKLVLHRKWVEEMEKLYKRYESGKIGKEEAERLMQEATDRKNSGRFS